MEKRRKIVGGGRDAEFIGTPFTGSQRYLRGLTGRDAAKVLADLLYAEAALSQIPSLDVSAPLNVDSADGGVDATVRGMAQPSVNGLLRPGLNSFQVKSGQYSLGNSSLKKLLFQSSGLLHPRVKTCLESDGVFTVVFTTVDTPDRGTAGLSGRLARLLREKHPNYRRDQVRALRSSDLAALIDKHPSVFLSVTQSSLGRLSSHDTWRKSREMSRPYIHDPDLSRNIIGPMRNAMRDRTKPRHIRFAGAPGVGKTRTVHVAADQDDLRPLVIYAKGPQAFTSSGILTELQHRNANIAAIVVIDECPPYDASNIWNEIQTMGPGIKLITVYHEVDQQRGEMEYLEMDKLSLSTIEEILKGHGVPASEISRIATLCDGAPRVAHVIGQNYGRQPDILRDLDTTNVWARYIEADLKPMSTEARQRQTTLEFLALFTRFGWRGSNSRESNEIHSLIQSYDDSINRVTFRGVVDRLIKSKILQGEFTLYITPKALQIYLWREWFEKHEDLELELLEKLSPDLRRNFVAMFRFAAESQAAMKIVERLLAADGPFKDLESLGGDIGGLFFQALSEAEPGAALTAIERILDGKGRSELLQFKQGRREVVRALESISIETDFFPRSARMLLALGEAENEPWTNNASGVFADLFSNGPGEVAPTAAPPSSRLPVLREAFKSSSPFRRELARRALDASLEAHHFVRDVGPEVRGIRTASPGWRPKTLTEWQECFLQAWKLGREVVEKLPAEEKMAMVKTLSERARGLRSRVPALDDEILSTLGRLAEINDLARQEVLDSTLHIIHFDGKEMDASTLERWRALRDKITGTAFHDRLLRYVRMQAFTDNFDDQGRHENQARPHIESLAREAGKDFSLLEPELNSLLGESSSNAFEFGRVYASVDRAKHLPRFWKTLEMADKPNLLFLGGYLAGLRPNNSDVVEAQLDAAEANPQLRGWAAELTRISGTTPRGVARLLRLAEKGVASPMAIADINAKKLSAREVNELVRRMTNLDKPWAAQAALVLLDRYYLERHEVTNPDFEPQVAFDALLKGARHPKDDARQDSTMDDYYWKELAMVLFKTESSLAQKLGEFMIDLLGEENSVLESTHDQAMEALNYWARSDPDEAWPQVARALETRSKRAFLLSRWLREAKDLPEGKEGALELFPKKHILEWVNGRPLPRAEIAATFVSVDLSPESLCREILSKHGASAQVRSALSGNWFTGTFMGSAVSHHENKRKQLIQWRQIETNANIIRWLDEEISREKAMIERSAEMEERWG